MEAKQEQIGKVVMAMGVALGVLSVVALTLSAWAVGFCH
jgi:hypothetical protein